MYGNGDKGMAIVCGCTWYLLRPDYGSVESLLMECIMLLIAEVIFYARAIIEKNLDGPIKLKESRPLGPDLLFATALVLIGGTSVSYTHLYSEEIHDLVYRPVYKRGEFFKDPREN